MNPDWTPILKLGFVDQGYSGPKPSAAASAHGIDLEVVKAPEAKRGFVLLPRRWVVERSFAWATRCRRLVKDYECYATTLAGLHMVAHEPRPKLYHSQPDQAILLGAIILLRANYSFH